MHANAKTRLLALMLAVIMLVSVAPLSIFAADGELKVSTYDEFVKQLEVLEGYANEYAKTAGKTANELIVNFIRTGVDRYNGGNWTTLAGEEITAFTNYVKSQDTAKDTKAMALRNIVIDDFKLPNGDAVDFGHMFGTLNIALINTQATGDLGGWAGDICDLMFYSRDYGNVPEGTIEEMAKFIHDNCFGVDADDAFGMDDFYGDMDAFYITKHAKAGESFTKIFKEYFTATLSDADRAAYFLNNRFKGLTTREQVRTAIYNSYSTNVGLKVLEADRELSDESDLRYASCYAFADYLFDLAGDRLTGEGGDDDTSTDFTFKVFSTADSTLAPGITQSINYALNSSNGQFVYYLSSIDVTRDDVFVSANYKSNDPSKGWGMQTVTNQMNAAQKNHSDLSSSNYIENYTPIVGINADFYNMSNGKPSGTLVMNGVTYNENSNNNFFGIKKDGTPIIGGKDEWNAYQDDIVEAVGGSILLIKDGEKLSNTTSTYYTTPGTRSVVGITADGKVIFLVVDGRQAPFSVGATVDETAQILLDAGCVIALHLDGGGSATYVSKPEGSDSLKLVNSPSDGYERSVSSSLIAVSTAKSSTEFDHANLTTDYDYLTIGTTLQLTATGVSNTGNAAAVPEDATWTLSDSSIGSISADGLFTAKKNGTVEVRLTVDGKIVGSKTLNVVVPDALAFTKQNFAVIYDVPFEVPIQATYKNNKVKINASDVMIFWEFEETEGVASVDGFNMTVNSASGIRTMRIAVMHYHLGDLYDETAINMYAADEAYFDFDNVTAGNRTLAWIRKVFNSTEESENYYHITDPKKSMTTEYTFGLDMSALEIPAQLADLTYMLPGAENGATAWDFLLQLAERVSVLTEVKISMTIDSNFDVDYSDLKLSTDFFTLKDVSLNKETNVLTITFAWIDRTMAVDPATANPICILSGLKLTPKADASWNSDNVLAIRNIGEVSYKIYLRANALYNFAVKEENQQKYGLYPFVNPDVIHEGNSERGASFGSTYADFEDNYSLDKTNRNGWIENDRVLTYWKDNVKLTGTQYLPSYEDSSVKKFYNIDENGAVIGMASGFVTYNDNLYYAINGTPQTGWRPVTNDFNEREYYYFDTSGKAVNGEQKIDNYTYVFEDYKLIRGELVKQSYGAYRYRWAGDWVYKQWMTIDGYYYYFDESWDAATGLKKFTFDGEPVYYLFDKNGRWLSDFTGIYEEGGYSFYIVNGIKVNWPGLVKIGDYYYYFKYCDESTWNFGPMVKNTKAWVLEYETNGLLKEGNYHFDEYGHLLETSEIISDPPAPKSGFVEKNGTLYYYRDSAPYYAGLIKIDGDYYYAQPSGELVTGRTYRISKHNNLLPAGTYTFDKDGKIDFNANTDFKFTGYTLTLKSKIEMNFYTILPTSLRNDPTAYIEFKIGDLTHKLYAKDAIATDTAGIYRFTIPVDAYMMSYDISAKAYVGGKEVDSVTTSIRDYAMYMINNPIGYEDDIDFAKALLNYGAATQTQFDKNISDLANSLLKETDKAVPELSSADLEAYKATKDGDETFGSFTGMNLALGDAVRLNVYFKPAAGVDIKKVEFKVDGKPVTYKNGRITHENIMAWQLDDALTITATYEGKTLTYKCSAMTYCYNVLAQRENGNDAFSDVLVNLLCALRVYQQKSEIYK